MKHHRLKSSRWTTTGWLLTAFAFVSVALLTSILGTSALLAAPKPLLASPVTNESPSWTIGLLVLFGPLLSALFTLNVFDSK